MSATNGTAVIDGVTNDAENMMAVLAPYAVEVVIEGACPLIFHRWSDDAVEAKAAAAKNSKAKKTDDVESYVYRNAAGLIGLPGEYLRMAIVMAAKFRQDPRSSRKSGYDLYRAAVVSLTEVAPIVTSTGKTTKEWDYIDRRRATVQRAGITRHRPAFHTGWRATIVLQVNLPEYVSAQDLQGVLTDAGRAVGVGDFRPTYGRFNVVGFKILR